MKQRRNIILGRVFSLVIIYYWALLAFVDISSSAERGNLLYILVVCPIVIFTAFAAIKVFQKKTISVPSILFIFYLSSVCFIGIFTLDYDTITSTVMFLVPVIVLIELKLKIDLSLLNMLFCLSVIWSVISYYIGINPYGFLPGQSTTNLHQGLWWRVSLLPYTTPPVTGLFALIVLLSNVFLHHSRIKIIWIITSIYFLVLSGSRTAILAIVLNFLVLSGIYFNNKMLKKIMLFLLLGFVIVLGYYFVTHDYTQLLSKIKNPNILSLLVRNTSFDETTRITGRVILWQNYLEVWSNSPIAGVGSFDIKTYFPDSPGNTEARMFYLLSRDGIILFTFFAIAIGSILWTGFMKKKVGYLIVSITFIVYMLLYSSFFNFYHFIYLSMWGLLNHRGIRKSCYITPQSSHESSLSCLNIYRR